RRSSVVGSARRIYHRRESQRRFRDGSPAERWRAVFETGIHPGFRPTFAVDSGICADPGRGRRLSGAVSPELARDCGGEIQLLSVTIEFVKELRPLTAKEIARAERKLLYPTPGSRIDAAQKHGIDLTLLLSQLRESPADRARNA